MQAPAGTPAPDLAACVAKPFKVPSLPQARLTRRQPPQQPHQLPYPAPLNRDRCSPALLAPGSNANRPGGATGPVTRTAYRIRLLDRSSVRYRRRRPDDAPIRAWQREIAAGRRRFGYRRLHVPRRRDGLLLNHT
jgi:hypothetical protein